MAAPMLVDSVKAVKTGKGENETDGMIDFKDDEDRADVWLFDSITMYKQLHMYELQKPAKMLEWSSTRTLCVTVQHSRQRSEILELSLPDKLLAAADDQGIRCDRDFHVQSGGFHDGAACNIKFVGNRSLALADETDTALHIYKLGCEKSDIMKKVTTIPVSCIRKPQDACKPCLTVSSEGKRALLGRRCDSVAFVDITKETAITDITEKASTEALSGLHFLDEHCFVSCSQCGQLRQYDLREKPTFASQAVSPNVQKSHRTMRWTSAACTDHVNCINKTYDNSSRLYLVSDQGVVIGYDSRMLCEHLFQHRIETGHSNGCLTMETLSLEASCVNDNKVSLNGSAGQVSIYTLPPGITEAPLQPVFIHQGHKACTERENVTITGHIWHPQIPELVITAADDGSLHAWQPNY